MPNPTNRTGTQAGALDLTSPEWGWNMRAPTDACKYSLTTLTTRERQIVGLVSKGLSNREVASRLNLSEGTIKAHLHNIYQKLAISNRTALTALAVSLSRQLEATEASIILASRPLS
jgi:DNA-binding NarL/FixJ family response regulator